MTTEPTLIAIDPGTEVSGIVWLWGPTSVAGRVEPNEAMREHLMNAHGSIGLAMEMMEPRGMPTSRHEMETLLWLGRFWEVWGGPWTRVYRRQVKMHLCGDSRAKDAHIRRAILDRFPQSGGGKEPAIGTKKKPGPLYGFSSHMWAALGVGLVAID